MATAKKQLASTVAAGAKKPAARPAATPAPRPATNALSIDPRLMGRFAQPLGRPSAPLPGIGQMEALRRALNGVPQQPSMPYQGPRFPGVGLPGFGGDPRFPGVGIPQFPQRPVFSDDYGRPPLVSVPQRPGVTFDPSLDPTIKAYLDRQRMLSATDAGVAYTFDPATQTFRGATMGGPVTMSLQDMQRAAAQDLARQGVMPGLGGMLGGPMQPPVAGLVPQNLMSRDQLMRAQAEQQAAFERDMQELRRTTGGPDAAARIQMEQQRFLDSQARERAAYEQALGTATRGLQGVGPRQMPFPDFGMPGPMTGPMQPPGGGMPDYFRPYFTGLTGLGSAGPMQPPVAVSRDMGPLTPQQYAQLQSSFGGPMQRPVGGMPGFGGGMPGFGGDPRFPGPGQMPQISGLLPNGAYAQQRPTTQAQPRPATQSNYGGFNNIQGMGANQYGGFTPPPMPSQPQPTQNQGGSMFGSFGNAQPNQNQNPNQQAQTTGQAPTGGGLF
jgi:hypothetical protein